MLASASAAQAAVSFVNFGLPSIGPDLRRHFGLSLPELGAVLTAALLGSGLALIAAGIAVDRLGARRATLAGSMLGAPSTWTDFGPPEKLMPAGRRASISATGMVWGTISE